MRHDAGTPPVAATPRKTTSSHALADARLYRPGPLVAGAVLLSPLVLALAAAGLSLRFIGRIPSWLPLILLLWLPLMVVAWQTMLSVRTSPNGIAVTRPWSRWNELRWTLIDRVERRGPRITIHTSDGLSVRLYPAVLHDGARLKRELLMRLPIHVLDARLRGDARGLLGEPIDQRAQSLTVDPLQAHPRRVWSVTLATAIALAAAGALTAVMLPLPIALLCAAFALAVIALCGATLPLCLQTVTLTDAGIAIRGVFGRSLGGMQWDDIQLIERTPHERILRLRGARRLRCAGPALLSAAQGEVFRAYLQTRCLEHGALVIVRRWL